MYFLCTFLTNLTDRLVDWGQAKRKLPGLSAACWLTVSYLPVPVSEQASVAWPQMPPVTLVPATRHQMAPVQPASAQSRSFAPASEKLKQRCKLFCDGDTEMHCIWTGTSIHGQVAGLDYYTNHTVWYNGLLRLSLRPVSNFSLRKVWSET